MALIALQDVYFRYPGDQALALCGVSLTLEAGRRVVLIGRNGSGKSTLMLHCNGILRPDRGVVQLAGRPMAYDRHALREVRRRVGIVFQNPDHQLFSASVFQDVSFGPHNLDLSREEVIRRVQQAAELCEITDLLERPTHALSAGQKTRVSLAGVLAMEPDLLLADEVTASLDPWMRRQVLLIFERLVAQGKTVVISTHDLELARYWADLVAVMQAGRVLAVDTPGRVFADQDLLAHIGPPMPWHMHAP